MKKFLLNCVMAVLVLAANAQYKMSVPDPLKSIYREHPVVLQNHPYSPVTPQPRGSRGVVSSTRLHSERIGSAGNLLTVLDGTCNQIDVNESLNLVTFIHRNDNSMFSGSLAQYRYDVSHDRGNNWLSDIGNITNDPRLDNVTAKYPKGRFPQAGIFNPAGNTIPDSAYLVYSGTWHNDDNWMGQVRGRGLISGDTATYSCHVDTIYTSDHVAIATGFCHGAPGVFWNLNRQYTGSLVTGNTDPILTTGWVVEKGVWNTGTKEVDWTQQILPTSFVSDISGSTEVSVVAVPNIAFDPSGQYGWIACLGDITSDLDSIYDPIFWKTTDFGATWQGPIKVDLDSLSEVVAKLGQFWEDGITPTTGIPMAWPEDGDIVVDAWGNPHFEILVGTGVGYSMEPAGYDMWDLTYNPNASACSGGWNGWHGLYLDSLRSLRGNTTSDATPYTESNRPLASASSDGKRLFFFWGESDLDWTTTNGNVFPNLYGKGVDPEHYLFTKTFNYTEGDSLWGGETSNTSGGIFGGATYGTVSPVAIKNGESYNVPLVLTEIDYNAGVPVPQGASDQPAAFWYINNINFAKYDFTEGLSADVEIVGNAEETVNAGTTWTDLGATLTYLDTVCYHSGVLHLVTDSGGFNINVVGTYHITYYAEDANGNIYAADSRIVTVGATPVAGFTYSIPNTNLANRIQFVDQSTNIPTSWHWDFGDGTGSTLQNPLHVFTSLGTFHVCLYTSNSFGTSDTTCQDVVVTDLGIHETSFAQNISMFPNPSNGKAMITFIDNSSPEFTVTVYNVLGETVLNSTKYKAGTSRVELNLTNAASGMYMVKIQSNNGTAVKHLTIEQK